MFKFLVLLLYVFPAIIFTVLFAVMCIKCKKTVEQKYPDVDLKGSKTNTFISLVELVLMTLLPVINIMLSVIMITSFDELCKTTVYKMERQIFFNEIEVR